MIQTWEGFKWKKRLKPFVEEARDLHTTPGYTQSPGVQAGRHSLDKDYLWYGETEVNVPVSMGRVMANAISNCKAIFYPNETRLSLIANHSAEIMEAM